MPGPCPCGSEVLRLDTVRRRDTEAIRALDERLFSIPQTADFRAEEKDGRLHLTVLTTGEAGKELLSFGDKVSFRTVTPDDHALYHGKRRIERY